MNAEGVLPNWRLGCFKWANCCTACTHPSNEWGWSCLGGKCSAGHAVPASQAAGMMRRWEVVYHAITRAAPLLLSPGLCCLPLFSALLPELWWQLLALVKELVYFSGLSDSVWDSFKNHLQFFSSVFPSCFHFCSLLLAVGLVKTLANASTFTFSPTVSGLRLSFWLSELLQCPQTGFFCFPFHLLVVVFWDVSLDQTSP